MPCSSFYLHLFLSLISFLFSCALLRRFETPIITSAKTIFFIFSFFTLFFNSFFYSFLWLTFFNNLSVCLVFVSSNCSVSFFLLLWDFFYLILIFLIFFFLSFSLLLFLFRVLVFLFFFFFRSIRHIFNALF